MSCHCRQQGHSSRKEVTRSWQRGSVMNGSFQLGKQLRQEISVSFCPIGLLPETTMVETIYPTVGWQATRGDLDLELRAHANGRTCTATFQPSRPRCSYLSGPAKQEPFNRPRQRRAWEILVGKLPSFGVVQTDSNSWGRLHGMQCRHNQTPFPCLSGFLVLVPPFLDVLKNLKRAWFPLCFPPWYTVSESHQFFPHDSFSVSLPLTMPPSSC